MISIDEIRDEFAHLLDTEDFVIDKSGCKMLEITGAAFLATEESILGKPNFDYIERELEWYNSQSLQVKDIPGGVPEIWQQIASKTGFINSNYGWMIYSDANFNQYKNCLKALQKNSQTRQAVMIYTRPSMHYDATADGMKDFACTNAVQFLIRKGKLEMVVQMRSNDAWAGYRNDRHWQRHVQRNLSMDLNVPMGDIHWQVGSLHFYERQFYLVDHYIKSGETHIAKKDYAALYPDSEWAK